MVVVAVLPVGCAGLAAAPFADVSWRALECEVVKVRENRRLDRANAKKRWGRLKVRGSFS
jgi:hypothetical protein